MLSFLQEGLERRLSPSTLKVYVSAISAHHDLVESNAGFTLHAIAEREQSRSSAYGEQEQDTRGLLSHWQRLLRAAEPRVEYRQSTL